MAVGSALGSKIYSVASWQGVVVLATVSGIIALIIRLFDARQVAQTVKA